ncbi:SusC/RagA family TonB-linked outer membrane protein [Parapedobacter tibetensis]|uniref:SusC/RagA family TonB-linked outer membrane protein n=1 Tax=Parapedobacter tibetensis TaxID=2972951 RepID=UPI00214DDDC5|nr:TonB-dependent receptor [Parapedobacter tibetensis]
MKILKNVTYTTGWLVWLMLFCLHTGMLQAQTRTVSGTVTDGQGQPLHGVTVTLKGTSTSTQTDAKGNFSIQSANESVVLVFSLIGFEKQEVIPKAATQLQVTLVETNSRLDEVIVVGYGTQKKRNVTGSIVSVSSEDIAERQALNVFDALQGMASGVQIAQESGRPGAESSVRIRGTATMEGGANPLYIVDGAQGVDISSINPDDIESVEILKDGASAAIYGSRSANGVIIITTKRSKAGQPQIKVNYLNSYNNLSHKVPQANAEERRLYERKRGGSGNTSIDSLNPAFNADNDMQDLITQTAQRHQVDLSMSGSSEKLNYYSSLGLLDEDGIILNSWYKRLTGRLNMDYTPNKRFTYGNRLQFSYRNDNRIHEGNTLAQALRRPPTFAVYFPDGTLAPTISGARNPLAWALLNEDEFDIYDANIYNYFKFNIIDGLKFTADGTFRFNYDHNREFTPKLLNTNTGATVTAVSNGSERDDITSYWMVQGFFNYDKNFGGSHDVTGVLGVSAERESFRRVNIAGNNWVSEEIPSMNAAQELILNQIYTNGIRSTQASAFGRLGYSFRDRYIVESNFRLDGSSRFGKDSRWGFFPSIAGAWRFSDETFMQATRKFLDDAKVRISYGVTGNDRIGQYDAIQRYVFGSNFYNGVSGVVPNTLFGNSTLSWETTKQLNTGLDLSFFKGRLTIEADYYDKITDDLLYNAPLASETGFDNVRVNLGSIQNRGVEFTVGGSPLRKQHFNWHTSINFSRNRGTVRELADGTQMIVSGIWLVEEGQPLGNFYGWQQLGVYAYDESNAWSEDWQQLTPNFSDAGEFSHYTLNGQLYNGNINQLETTGSVSKGGDAIWLDANGDGIIDETDRIILGNAQPNWMAGWNNSFTYKNFGLSFNFYFSYGGSLYNQSRWLNGRFTTSGATPDPYIIHNAWWHPGDVTDVPLPRNNGMDNMRELNSFFVEDASFIRLRNAKFTYKLPARWVSPIGISLANVYVYGNNLFTWTNYSMYDPEISFGNPLQMGRDTGRYPRKREIGVGLNINF